VVVAVPTSPTVVVVSLSPAATSSKLSAAADRPDEVDVDERTDGDGQHGEHGNGDEPGAGTAECTAEVHGRHPPSETRQSPVSSP
jgi:hypothetical protein